MAVAVTKPKIVQNMAIYDIGHIIDKNRESDCFINIEHHRPVLKSIGVKAVLFSMAGCEAFDKELFLQITCKNNTLFKELNVTIGVCNYSQRQFNILREILGKRDISLFKNVNIAALAVGTSKVGKNSGVLVYSPERDEKAMICSDLISRGYFLVMASCLDDFKKKYEQKGSYSLAVLQSRFGSTRNEVTVLFKNDFYLYSIGGVFDENVNTRFDVKAHKNRLERGYKAFVFDMSEIVAMDTKGVQFLSCLANEAALHSASLAIFGLDMNVVDKNEVLNLQNCPIKLYNGIDDIKADGDFTKLKKKSKNGFMLGKEHAGNLALFSSAAMSTIKTYGRWYIKRTEISIMSINEFCLKNSVIQSSMVFDGDMEGSLLFAFPKETAKLIFGALTGEKEDLTDNEYIDVLNEFVDSVAGKIKSSVLGKKAYIDFSLPNSSLSRDKKFKNFDEVQGVVARITVDDKPLDIMVTACILQG